MQGRGFRHGLLFPILPFFKETQAVFCAGRTTVIINNPVSQRQIQLMGSIGSSGSFQNKLTDSLSRRMIFQHRDQLGGYMLSAILWAHINTLDLRCFFIHPLPGTAGNGSTFQVYYRQSLHIFRSVHICIAVLHISNQGKIVCIQFLCQSTIVFTVRLYKPNFHLPTSFLPIIAQSSGDCNRLPAYKKAAPIWARLSMLRGICYVVRSLVNYTRSRFLEVTTRAAEDSSRMVTTASRLWSPVSGI